MVKSIKELKGTESGSCVIIGSGLSVDDFDFNSIPEDYKRIAVNRCFVDARIDYQIYSDLFFLKWIERFPINEDVILIGFEGKTSDRVDYFFNWKDMEEGFHTGFYALQMAEILGFKKIYLVGFDYYSLDGKLHYYEGKHETVIQPIEKKFYSRLLNSGRWINDFNRIDWKAEIYNCNPDSKLKKFKIKTIGGN